MARVIALAHNPARPWQHDLLRVLVVCGCALALIFARNALPF
ncbi:hypothetical protein [Novosphingobium album (ex Liu et al. 2023)]|uniref:Uncharacterized protein n=1 Tax=Novosphingobium album (ex Liu et al. 2023) TaxID=3031130 RepID=A0ABT5WVA0_9SPHN|nr:hypothetical protein [Novosphingobium album (ex Liu et al. 2023)]MDE8653782.1 hypothetical protein [Novosphingobium album (ex Liu et al. 2023)]